MSTFEENTINILQRQYLYTNIANLAVNKAKIFDKYITNEQNAFISEILNIKTCSSQALDNYWGKIFKITRTFYNSDTQQEFTLTDDEFREIIYLRAFATSWDGCLFSLNEFLGQLFQERGEVGVIDALNMTTLIFSFDFKLKDWELYLFKNTNILPRPAGVGSQISIINTDQEYFGFASYNLTIQSPITVGFGTYTSNPMGNGKFTTYNDNVY